MKFSTRTRYGLRLLIYLAARDKQGFIQLKEIAAAEDVSVKYLEQIILVLKPAGILFSSRGASGGYKLKQEPAKLKLSYLFRILEGSLEPIDCLQTGYHCRRQKKCPATEVWEGLKQVIVDYLDKITLDDLVAEYKQKNKQAMFYI
ncbi:MAG TPA: Rrf2 family transcriptional regulator [Spirochaetota bacterium]|nr:Rrf2 family transcriptional regulator [Spirochaetota bacterium]